MLISVSFKFEESYTVKKFFQINHGYFWINYLLDLKSGKGEQIDKETSIFFPLQDFLGRSKHT